MNWSESQFADYLRRINAAPTDEVCAALPRVASAKRKMNATEAAYSEHLESLRILGEIVWHKFEPMKLRLAEGAYFTPDFGVKMRDGSLQFHETKGFWRESAKVRIKVAAEIFPFKFIAIKRAKGGGWEREEF